MKLVSYLQMMRPLNCFMTAMAVFVGGLVVSLMLSFPWLDKILLAMAAAFLIAGGGNAINDYVDVEADKINRPSRPIPSGSASRDGALCFSMLLFVAGIVLAGLINYVTFAIAIINTLVLVFYSTHLQNKMLLGNISISYLVASGFLFGGAALNNLLLPVLISLLAGCANMSREIVKDLEDMEGDRLSFLKRIAKKTINAVAPSIAERFGFDGKEARMKYSVRRLSTFAVFFLLVTIIISPLPFLYGISGYGYLAVVSLADLMFFIAAVFAAKATRKNHYHRASRMIKFGMLLGLVAFIVGTFV